MTIATINNTQTQALSPRPQGAKVPKQESGAQTQTLGREEFLARRAVFSQGATPRQFVDAQSVKQLESALDLNKGGSLRNLSSIRPSSLNNSGEQESGEHEYQQPGGKPQASKSVRPPAPHFEHESTQSESDERQ